MRQCPQCGKSIGEEAKVCPACGASCAGSAGDGALDSECRQEREQRLVSGQQRQTAAARLARTQGSGVQAAGSESSSPEDAEKQIPCPDCGRLVPFSASVCPYCGEPMYGGEQWQEKLRAKPPKLPRALVGGGCGCLALLVFFGVLALFSFLGAPRQEEPPVQVRTKAAGLADQGGQTMAKAEGDFTVSDRAYACRALEDYKALARMDRNGEQEALNEELNMKIATGKCRVLPLGATVTAKEIAQADRALRVHLKRDSTLWWTGLKMLTP